MMEDRQSLHCRPSRRMTPPLSLPEHVRESRRSGGPDVSPGRPQVGDAVALAYTAPAMHETDVILIGAGPIGLEMAVALRQAGVDYAHLEARQVGHTISWFPRQARFFSSTDRIAIAGVPLLTVDQSKASREEYLAYLWSVVQQFQLPIRAYERVVSIRREGEGASVGFTWSASGRPRSALIGHDG